MCGLTDVEVAHQFGVSVFTVKNTLYTMRKRMGAVSTVEAAVIWATRNCDHV